MTKDKESIDFFDAEGNRIGTLDATTPKNEFNPDWNQMAVLVEQSQDQAAKIEQLEKQLAERSAEYLAAHITYDNGYEAGRQDEPVHGDIRALRYRIFELEGENLGYKRMLDVAEAPPKRTPLTDAEIEATFLNCNGKWDGDQWVIEDADFHPFARAIEAAHGIIARGNT